MIRNALLSAILIATNSICAAQSSDSVAHFEIPYGNAAGELTEPLGDVDFVSVDFEVTSTHFFISDFFGKRINEYALSGSYVKSFALPAEPEIIKRRGTNLYVLLRNSEIACVDILSGTLRTVDLKPRLHASAYDHAYFIDSLLLAPTEARIVWLKSDGMIYDLSHFPQIVSRKRKRLFDLDKKLEFAPSDSGGNIQRALHAANLAYGSSDIAVFETGQIDEGLPTKSTRFTIVNPTGDSSRSRSVPVEMKYNDFFMWGTGRGVRVFDDFIYYIILQIDSPDQSSVVISRAKL